MCNTGICYTCITCIEHDLCITHVSAKYVIHLHFHTYNIPKTPHMYYKCSTNGCVGMQCE